MKCTFPFRVLLRSVLYFLPPFVEYFCTWRTSAISAIEIPQGLASHQGSYGFTWNPTRVGLIGGTWEEDIDGKIKSDLGLRLLDYS